MHNNRRHNRDPREKPELVLRKAKELYEAGRSYDALTTISNSIDNKNRQNQKNKFRPWSQKDHPEMMKLYIKLCVELKEGYKAKNGLYSVKSMTQHMYPEELEKIIRYYLKLAKDKVKEAKKTASKESVNISDQLKDIEDLENVVTAEALLLKSVTAKTSEDRSEKMLIAPWYKFMWDAYKTMLDLLSVNNIKLENMYKEVAHEACNFCLENERTLELRRLGDTFKKDLRNLTENQGNKTKRDNMVALTYPVGTSEPNKVQQILNSQEIHTEIRYKYLQACIQLKLWQSAHNTIDDISNLKTYTRRINKSYPNTSKFQSKFLKQMSIVFAKSGHHLFHAATLQRIFILTRDMKAIVSDKQKQALKKLAAQTLVATLAIPLTEKQPGLARLIFDFPPQNNERFLKWCRILNYEGMPSRDKLTNDIQYKGVIQYVPDKLKALFKNLESEFNPLRLSNKVDECFRWLVDEERNEFNEILLPYKENLQHVTASRVIRQVSEIYETIDFERLHNLVPFYNKFQLEQHILDDCRSGKLRAKFNQQNNSVNFGSKFDPTPLCITTSEDNKIISLTNGKLEEKDWLNQHLNAINSSLSKASVAVRPKEDREKSVQLFQEAAKIFKKNDDQICDKFSKRRNRIEEIKKEIETAADAEALKQKMLKEQKIAEDKAAKEEADRIIREEKDRIRNEEETKENQLKYFESKISELKKDDKSLPWIEHIEPEDLMDMTTEEAADKQIDGLRKQKIDNKKSLCRREDDKDYLERAKRQVEQKHLDDTAEERHINEQNAFKREKEDKLRKARDKFKENVEFKQKFKEYKEKIDACTEEVTAAAEKTYQDQLQAYNDMKQKTIQERRLSMRDEFKQRQMERFNANTKVQKTNKQKYEQHLALVERERKEQERRAKLQEQNPMGYRPGHQGDNEQQHNDGPPAHLQREERRPISSERPSMDDFRKPETDRNIQRDEPRRDGPRRRFVGKPKEELAHLKSEPAAVEKQQSREDEGFSRVNQETRPRSPPRRELQPPRYRDNMDRRSPNRFNQDSRGPPRRNDRDFDQRRPGSSDRDTNRYQNDRNQDRDMPRRRPGSSPQRNNMSRDEWRSRQAPNREEKFPREERDNRDFNRRGPSPRRVGGRNTSTEDSGNRWRRDNNNNERPREERPLDNRPAGGDNSAPAGRRPRRFIGKKPEEEPQQQAPVVQKQVQEPEPVKQVQEKTDDDGWTTVN